MPRIYTAEFENQTVAIASGDVDLFSLVRSFSGRRQETPFEIIGLNLSVLSELGEAQEEWLRLRIIRGHTTFAFSGGHIGEAKMDEFDTASVIEGWYLETAVASGGTPINLWSEAWNVRQRYQRWWPSGLSVSLHQQTDTADTVVVRLMAAAVDDLTMSGTIMFAEL